MTVYYIALFVTGLVSIFAQSLFARELLVAFGGNEMGSGVILASSLCWTGIGSFFASRLTGRLENTVKALSYLLCVFSITILSGFFLIMHLRPLLGVTPGELIHPWILLVTPIVVLAPFGLSNGFIFSMSLQGLLRHSGSAAVGMAYSIDAMGDMVGGILYSFFFVYILSPFLNILVIVFCVSAYACFLFMRYKKKTGKTAVFFVLIGISIAGAFLIKSAGPFFTVKEWGGYTPVGYRHSLYGDLYLARYQDYYALYENGILGFTFPEPLLSEEDVHLTFLEASVRERVLVIGEGVKGLLSEALKYNPKELYYLELDPALISLVAPFLSGDEKGALTDPRVRIYNLEARTFLRSYKGAPFDVIMLNTPAPYTAYLNRFYTYEFFKDIRSILSPEGVFSFTLPSKEAYLPLELRSFEASIYHTLSMVFDDVLLIPGERLRLIASSSGAYLSADPSVLARRFDEAHLKTRYVDAYYFSNRLLPWHLAYLNRTLKAESVRRNYDFVPVAYYYGMDFFASRFKGWFSGLFAYVGKIPLSFFYATLLLIWSLLFFIRRRSALALSVVSIGACGMASVIFTIFGFQIVYGYVYHKIGMISAAYMMGLAAGSFYVSKRIHKTNGILLCGILVSAGVYVVCIPLLFMFLRTMSVSFAGGIYIVPLLMGVACGAGFPLANMIYLEEKISSFKGAGFLYACDLVGGGIAGVLLSLFLIPLYGMVSSARVVSFSLFVSGLFLSLLIVGAKRNRRKSL